MLTKAMPVTLATWWKREIKMKLYKSLLILLFIAFMFGKADAKSYHVKYVSVRENIYLDAGSADSLFVGDYACGTRMSIAQLPGLW